VFDIVERCFTKHKPGPGLRQEGTSDLPGQKSAAPLGWPATRAREWDPGVGPGSGTREWETLVTVAAQLLDEDGVRR